MLSGVAVLEKLNGMDTLTAEECIAAWKEHNKVDGPKWENNARYRAEFAAGFAAARKQKHFPVVRAAEEEIEPVGEG